MAKTPEEKAAYMRDYMRKYRLKRKVQKPAHIQCDRLLARSMEEKDSIIAAKNREIGELKQMVADLSSSDLAQVIDELKRDVNVAEDEIERQAARIRELEKPQVVQTMMYDPLADLDL